MHQKRMTSQKRTQSSKRKFKTEMSYSLYQQHLQIKKKAVFEKCPQNPQQTILQKPYVFNEETNFGFSMQNQFAYVLLHLRSKNNKNRLNLNIPEVCIFVDKTPYDILSSQNGFIRGFKAGGQHSSFQKCRLKDIIEVFKQEWRVKQHPRFEHISTVFKCNSCLLFSEGAQVLLMSQADFIFTCKKMKNDPIFKKIEYFQNKLPYVGQQIIVPYDYSKEDEKILKLATESLLGFREQVDIRQQLGSQNYLAFLNEKIALALNYQHSIRILKGNMHYVKNKQGQYFLVNVTKLTVNNFTKPLNSKMLKQRKIEQARCEILKMTPEKEKRYKSYQRQKQVKRYELTMKESFEKIVKDLDILSITESKNQQVKNELAFRRLHPKIKQNYREFITSGDFRKTKEKLFGSNIANRKPISIPSKYVLRSYNKVKSNYGRCATQSAQTFLPL